ncbi:MAG TPA: permease, partial [Thermoanaerobaculia bacterium]|nr:permease [Thermoanaerobaculia bacterium]
MDALQRFSSALFTLFATSSGFLLFGLFAAGVVHTLAPRLERLQSRVTRGMKAIGFGILAGLPLPICSCGIVPVALALRRRNSYPETAASFLVSTPETSLDAVGLTAALLGVPFAILRVLAGLTAAVLAGIFVIATEAWPGKEEPAIAVEGGPSDSHAVPDWWPRLVNRALALWKEWFGRIPKAEGEEPVPVETRRSRIRRAIVHAMRIGLVEILDEISWMLLFGFTLSALLLTFLPADFAGRVPGGLVGQIIFGLAISLPLYICASGSVPLVAALVVKGLSPVAALVMFLIGPITNPAMLLMLRKSFGRRFLGSLLIAGMIAAAIFGSILAAM